jgi:hypothetical protein
MTCPMPSHVPGLSLFLAVNERLHPVIVEAIRLDQVNDVEFVRLVLPCVSDSEVEPL